MKMGTRNPKVSVIMSVYNGERFLRESVESILNQTFNDFEFIIINDGSTDGTEEILNSYKDKRLRIFDQPNRGLIKSLNRAIELSKGEYIARQDADDISLPERIEKQVDFLNLHKDITVLGTFAKVIDEASCFTGEVIQPTNNIEPAEIKRRLYLGNCVAHPTVMYRRIPIEKLGGYNEEFQHCEDYELWLRIVEEGYDIGCLPGFLCLYRQHNFQISTLFRKTQIEGAEKARKLAIKRGLKKTKGKDDKAFLIYALGVLYCEQEKYKEAIKELGKAFSLDPKELSLKSDILLYKGIVGFDQREYNKAINLFSESLNFDPENIKACYTLGSCYQKKGEWDKSIEKFTQVLSIKTNSKEVYHAGAHFHLGEICQAQGNLDKAKIEFEKCLEYNPGHRKAKKFLEGLLRANHTGTEETVCQK